MSNSEALNPESRITSLLRDSARLILLSTIFVGVWMVGGYYSMARFMMLALLTLACTIVWFGGVESNKSMRSAMPLLFLMLAGLLYGMLQLVPLSQLGVFDWTGVSVLQSKFGVSTSDVPQAQTLTAWMTQSWLAMAMIGVGGYFLASRLINDDPSRLLLLFALALCGVGQVFWGLVQVSTDSKVVFGMDVTGGTIPFGSFFNRNHAADFIGMSLASVVGLAWWQYSIGVKRRPKGYRQSIIRTALTSPVSLGIWLALIWLALGLVLSMSRGGWLAVGFGLCFVPICWSSRKKGRRVILIVVSAVVLASVFFAVQFFGFGDQVDKRLDDLEIQNVMSDARWSHWSEALPAAQFFLPFGSGLGTYGYAYLPFDPEPDNGWFTHAHNQYLEVFMEAGVPGLLLLCLAIVFAIRLSLKLCRSDRSITKQSLGIAVMAAVVLQVTHAFTDFGLMMPANLLTFMVLLGAASSAVQSRKKPKRGPRNESPDPETNGRSTSSFSTTGVFAINAIVLVSLTAALWQQGRHVRAERILAETDFNAGSPAPAVDTTDEWISKVEAQAKIWPAYEPTIRRLTRLNLHRAQRVTYDQLREAQKAANQESNAIEVWNATSIESIVMRLFDNSETRLDEQQRQMIHKEMQTEPNLASAWEGLNRGLALNPLVPRLHLRMAQLASASGRPWKSAFQKSIRLSVVDPKQSIGNGLLAWAAGDADTMTQQWQRSLSTDWTNLNMVFALASSRLNEEEIVSQLMPEKWIVPFRLAQQLRGDDKAESIRQKLLHRSAEIAKKTLPNDGALYKSLGHISTARGELPAAAKLYEKAIESDPSNPELRHLAAVALYQLGDAKQAVRQARVATLLAPKDTRFRDFYRRMQNFHRQQYTNLLNTTNESSRPKPQ